MFHLEIHETRPQASGLAEVPCVNTATDGPKIRHARLASRNAPHLCTRRGSFVSKHRWSRI